MPIKSSEQRHFLLFAYKNQAIACLLLLVIGMTVAQYPLAPLVLLSCLVAYGYGLYRYPNSWLFFIPALLPVLDFTPLTGRFFFDEFDLLLLTTVAVNFWRKPTASSQLLFSKATIIIGSLFSFFYVLSVLRGLLPLQFIDDNAFSNYYSYYNALRVGKGFIWGWLLLPALKQALQHNAQTSWYFAYGVLAGLFGVIMVAIVERWVFTGLFDFSSHYRINALFSSMHTGGGHIESYLMLSLPFIAVLFFRFHVLSIAGFCGLFLFITGLYVLLVTFSRGGYIGFVIGFSVFIICLVIRTKSTLKYHWKQVLGVSLLILLVPVLAIPVFKGQLIQHRFSIFSEDKLIRTNHWLDAIAMMDDTLVTRLLGMGVGSYPRTYFWLNTESVIPATYKIERESDNPYLRLRGGHALFIGQMLAITPHTDYQLQLDARSELAEGVLGVAICEKSVMYSLRCSNLSLALPTSSNKQAWQTLTSVINTNEVGSKSAEFAGGLLTRPVQLTFLNHNGAGKVVDIDNVKLSDQAGNNLLTNGDFSQGTDRWFFATEKHHPWHILNMWVHVLFDQGLLGLILFVLLLLKCCCNLCIHLAKNSGAIVFLSSLCAFLVVGWVDSPFDNPRITLLFFLIVVYTLTEVPSLTLPTQHEKYPDV